MRFIKARDGYVVMFSVKLDIDYTFRFKLNKFSHGTTINTTTTLIILYQRSLSSLRCLNHPSCLNHHIVLYILIIVIPIHAWLILSLDIVNGQHYNYHMNGSMHQQQTPIKTMTGSRISKTLDNILFAGFV